MRMEDRHICSLVYQVCTCGHHYIQMDDPPEDRVIMCSDCGTLLALSYQGGLYEIGKRLL